MCLDSSPSSKLDLQYVVQFWKVSKCGIKETKSFCIYDYLRISRYVKKLKSLKVAATKNTYTEAKVLLGLVCKEIEILLAIA